MADNGIDFGQTSQVKYSLNSLQTPQIAGMNIAQDMAQAITVGGNLGKYFSQNADEASQAKYFNAVTNFNNLKAQQQQELLEAGADLTRQRAVLDKYTADFGRLSTEYELNDKYSTTLGSSIQAHNDGLETTYRHYYNAQRKDEALANTTEVITASLGLSKEQLATQFDSLKSYLATEAGLTDRAAGTAISKIYANSIINSLSSKEDLSYEEAKAARDSFKEVLTSYDPKIIGDEGYKQALNGFSTIAEQQRTKRYQELIDNIRLGNRPIKETLKAIDNETASGVVSKDKAEYVKALAVKEYTHQQAMEVNANTTLANREIALSRNQLVYSNVSPEEFEKKMFALADKNGWDKRMVMDEISSYKKSYGNEINKEAVRQAKSELNDIKSRDIVVAPEKANSLVVNSTTDGVVSEENNTWARMNNFRFIQQDSKDFMSFTDAVKSGHLVPSDYSEYTKAANNEATKAIMTGNLSLFSKLHSTYGVKGNIDKFITDQISDPNNYGMIKQQYDSIKSQFPNSYKDIIGKDNAGMIEMIDKEVKLTGKLTPDSIRNAENRFKQNTKLLHDDSKMKQITTKATNNGIVDVNGFQADVLDYMQLGKTFSEALDLSIKDNKETTHKSFNFTGAGVTLNNDIKQLLDNGFKNEFTDKHSNITGFVYNRGTRTMWASVAGNTMAFDTKDSYDLFIKRMERYADKEGSIPVDNGVNYND